MTYGRAISLESSRNVVHGELLDDFHDFAVDLTHDGERATQVTGVARRFPWSTCPGAVSELASLTGLPLTTLTREANARAHCTHLFDLAALAASHAAAQRATRRYDITVADRVDGRTRANLARDGVPLLEWSLHWLEIDAPASFAGVSLRGGFLAWAGANLDPETAEAAAVLRRACDISMGRMFDLDLLDDASSLIPRMKGTCFTFQPGRMEHALRMKGSAIDHSPR